MAIIVETGTGLDPTANSYGSVAGYQAYNGDRGLPFDTDATKAAQNLLRAMDKLESLAYIGIEVIVAQPLEWPRTYLPDGAWDEVTGVDPRIVKAQYRLASILSSGVDLFPVIDSFGVKSEKVGPLETVYDTSTGTQYAPLIGEVDDLLNPLLDGSGKQLIRSYRA